MTRSIAARVTDIRVLIDAARRVADDVERIAPEIAQTTGLSIEGVRLGFARHLELDVPDSDLRMLVARAGDAPRVHVILSSGVFVGALRALCIARSAAPRVTVRPSRRDPVFVRALVEAARDPAITLTENTRPEGVDAGEIHVYGRDETAAAVRASAPPGVLVRSHGTGLGIACVSRRAVLAHAAEEIARDVIPFDQRGCLSPRVVFVEGDDGRAETFAEALHDALVQAALRAPRGRLDPSERAEAVRYVDTLAFAGRVWQNEDHVVGWSSKATLILPPTGRCVHVQAIHDADDLRTRLAPIARYVVAFGTDSTDGLGSGAPPHARVSALGQMQCPKLDGPVDLRPSF